MYGNRDFNCRFGFLTIGLVIDMWTERVNDSVKYKRLASQEDFDKF